MRASASHAVAAHCVRPSLPGRARVLRAAAARARARLENVVAGVELVLPVRRLARNGFEAWAEVVAGDYEGYVAKDETSLYEAGPTRRWLKVKQKSWTDAEDRWQRRISASA